jgi:hypothetical protein
MATDPTPVILPDLPTLAANPIASGLKRFRTLPHKGEGEFKDTRAFGSGTHTAAEASGSTDPILPLSLGSTGQETDVVPPEQDRATVVTAFIGSLLLHGPTQLRVDDLATLLALAVEGPAQKAAFHLLVPAYSQQKAAAI